MDGPTHDIQKTHLYEDPHCYAELPENQAHPLTTHSGSNTYTSVMVWSHPIWITVMPSLQAYQTVS